MGSAVAVNAARNNIKDVNKIYVGQPLVIPTPSNVYVRISPNSPTYYWVAAGDNLTKISKKFGTAINQIVAWNDIKNPNLIKIGQRLRVK
jgi:LysM repeat protein